MTSLFLPRNPFLLLVKLPLSLLDLLQTQLFCVGKGRRNMRALRKVLLLDLVLVLSDRKRILRVLRPYFETPSILIIIHLGGIT